MRKQLARGEKAAAVRKLIESNPQASPAEMMELLKKQGIPVSDSFLSSLRKKAMAKEPTAVKGMEGMFAFTDLQAMTKYVHAVGSVERAQQLLSAFSRVKELAK